MAAEVGLLSRNVKIYGKTYSRNGDTMETQGFGGRVLVAQYGNTVGTFQGKIKLPKNRCKSYYRNHYVPCKRHLVIQYVVYMYMYMYSVSNF